MSEQTFLDIAPEMVEISEPVHLAGVWHSVGVMSTAKHAREIADKHKIVGMTLMADLLEAHALKVDSHTKLLNIALAAKHGMDFTAGSLVLKTDGAKAWLYMLPPNGDVA